MFKKQKEIESLNRPKTNEIEAVIKNLPTKESLRLYGFIGEFFQTFREESIQVLLKLF